MRELRRWKPASLRLCALLHKPDRAKVDVGIDYLGAVTLAGAVLAGLLALTRASIVARDGSAGDLATDSVLLALVVACLVGIVAFVRVENRTSEPMLQLRYFRRRNFTMPMVSSSLMQFAYMGGFVVTPALLGNVYGLSVGAIALLLASRPGSFSLASPLGGYLATAIGERRPVILGAMAMVASMGAFAVASGMSGAAGLTLVVVGLTLSGVSAGVSQPAVSSMVVGAVDSRDMGIANGMSQQIMFIGIVSGIQAMNVFLGDGATSGRFATTFVFGGVVAALSLDAALATRDSDQR